MDWTILIGMTLTASVVVALAASVIARRMGQAGGEPAFWTVLAAIVISAVVLLGVSRLALLVDWSYARAGIDPATALGGQFRVLAFAASFVPIAAYVVTFLLTFKRVKG